MQIKAMAVVYISSFKILLITKIFALMPQMLGIIYQAHKRLKAIYFLQNI